MTQKSTSYDRYQADFAALQDRVPELRRGWAGDLRRKAMSRFTQTGFPTELRGNEEWRFSNVGPIARKTFEYPFEGGDGENGESGVTAGDLRRLAPWDEAWTTMVFLNGRYSPSLSTAPGPSNGAGVRSLAEAMAVDGTAIEANLGRYADVDTDDGFASVNTAFFHDGAFVHVDGDQQHAPALHLMFVTTESERQTVTYPRALVIVGANSKLTLVESYVSPAEGAYFTDAVTEIVAGDGSEIEHYRYMQESPRAYHIGITRVHQQRDSTFSSMCFATGAALARNDLEVALDAPGASCDLNGLYLTAGSEHIDNHINIDHVRPHTTSAQYYKGILSGKSKAVFSGRVLIRKDAQKTAARQSDKNLLLSRGARINTKPSLEIFADDVQAAHGATAGAVADEALFYMRSRGLDEETATKFLIQGFAAEILDKVNLEPFSRHLEGVIARALPKLLEGMPA